MSRAAEKGFSDPEPSALRARARWREAFSLISDGSPVALSDVADRLCSGTEAQALELSFVGSDGTCRLMQRRGEPFEPSSTGQSTVRSPSGSRVILRWKGSHELELSQLDLVEEILWATLFLAEAQSLLEQRPSGPSLEGLVELAGAAAHEMNQPLTSVMGTLELLRRKLEPGHPAEGYLEVLQEDAERMASVVDQLAHLVRFRTKPYVGDSDIFDLDAASQDD